MTEQCLVTLKLGSLLMLECGGPHIPDAHTARHGRPCYPVIEKCIVTLKLGSFLMLGCGGPHTPNAHIQQGMVDPDTL